MSANSGNADSGNAEPGPPRIAPFGDRAVWVEWPTPGYDADASARALGLSDALRGTGKFREVVPGYASVMVEFDPLALDMEDALFVVRDTLPLAPTAPPTGRDVEIPVRYGGEAGPDLARVCEAAGLSEVEAIQLHSGPCYRVCMMGFIPGFAFLSEVPAVLAHPRHATPRAHVPAGSVGIAGWQTGIYGLDSPGGWQIIGRTDAVMFDPRRDAPFLLEAGDRVRFVPR